MRRVVGNDSVRILGCDATSLGEFGATFEGECIAFMSREWAKESSWSTRHIILDT